VKDAVTWLQTSRNRGLCNKRRVRPMWWGDRWSCTQPRL